MALRVRQVTVDAQEKFTTSVKAISNELTEQQTEEGGESHAG
jgi:hypothetical protein